MKPKILFLSIAFLLSMAIGPSSYADSLTTSAQIALVSGPSPIPPFPPLPAPANNSANSGSISSKVSYSPNNSPAYPDYSKASADDTGKTAAHVLGWGIGGAVTWENYASATYTKAASGPHNFNFTISGPTLGILDPASIYYYAPGSAEYGKYLITISDSSGILWRSGATYSYSYDNNGNLITSLTNQIGTNLTGAESHLTMEQFGTITVYNDWKYQFDNYAGTIALSEAGAFDITTKIEVWAFYSGGERGAYASIGDPDNLSSSNFSSTLTPSSPSAVPEPATMLLFGSGLIGLWGVRRKLKK